MLAQKLFRRNLEIALFGVLIMAMILPFSMTSEYAAAQSIPSLKSQVDSGIALPDLTCKADRVLVIRDNGNPACVRENTAKKLGWEILNQSEISDIQYEYPLVGHVSGYTNAPVIETVLDLQVEISNLPKVGETAILTINATNYGLNNMERVYEGARSFETIISPNFEFVGISEDDLIDRLHWNPPNIRIPHYMNIEINESKIIDVPIRAVSEGEGFIHVAEFTGAPTFGYHVVVGNDKTMLADDYYDLHPNELSSAEKRILAKQAEEDAYEQKRQELRDQGKCHDVPRSDGPSIEFCPDQDLENSHTSYLDIPDNIDDARDFLRAEYSNDERHFEAIEELLSEMFPDDISTQSFYSNHDNFSLNARLITTSTSLAPSNVLSDTEKIHGAKACAFEIDTITGKYSEIECDYTSKLGIASFRDIHLPEDSQDGQIDITVLFTTEGEFAYVAPAKTNGQREPLSDQPYSLFSVRHDNVSEDYPTITVTPVTDNPETSAKSGRAFWIVDAVTTANKWLEDEFDLKVENRVNIGWQHNSGAAAEFGFSDDGARYLPSDDIIYLDGYTGSTPDDSYERFTVIHEYAHFVMDSIYDDGLYSDCPDSHSFFRVSAPICAMTEGWADVLPFFVDENHAYPRDIESTFNVEEGTRYNSDDLQSDPSPSPITTVSKSNSTHPNLGQWVEGQVAGALWDIVDDTTDSDYDTENGGTDSLETEPEWTKNILTQDNPNTFEDYYIGWQNHHSNYPDATDIMKLHYMDFVFPDDISPHVTITIPTEDTHHYVHEVYDFVVAGTASDNRRVDSITATLNGVDVPNVSTSSNNELWSAEFTASRTSNTFVVTATDPDGNTATDTLFIIIDKDDPPNPPDRPSKPESVFVSHDHITIQWTAPASDSPITGYDIYRQASPKELIATVDGSTTSYTDGTVQPDMTYRYSIIAKNANGDSQESEQIEVSTPAQVFGDMDIVSFTQNSTSIVFEWKPSVHHETNAVKYNIYYNHDQDPHSWVKLKNKAPAETSKYFSNDVENLQSNESVSYLIEATISGLPSEFGSIHTHYPMKSYCGYETIDLLVENWSGNIIDNRGAAGPTDKIVGTAAADLVLASDFGDTIHTGNGNDCVIGGTAKDIVKTGNGADTIFGFGGDDELWGQKGNDLIYGGDGDDKIYGNWGNDELYGMLGDDKLYGKKGSDRMYGNSGNDRFEGDEDNDALFGGNGNDTLYAGENNDYCQGWAGDDTIAKSCENKNDTTDYYFPFP